MRYVALACDYDGTIAHDGRVNATTLAALEHVRNSGRHLILVTGRELDDLRSVFDRLDIFSQVVVENGALLYTPATQEEMVLGEPQPEQFVSELERRGVHPLSVGRSIVATWTPHETTVLEVIRDLGLEAQVIFNKGAVMVLPSGVNKATGLKVALNCLGLSPHNVVGVGDAENDHAFLQLCECSIAVANALPMLKERADFVTSADHGEGVAELIEALLASDLAEIEPRLKRHHVLLGTRSDGEEIYIEPYGNNLLLAGTSQGGKTTLATGLIERLIERDYQLCILDPEGDYSEFEGATLIGDSRHGPGVEEVMELLEKPDQSLAVNLLGIALAHRPGFFVELFPRLLELRARTGRPHWIVIDETHHMLDSSFYPAPLAMPQDISGILMITVKPDHVAPAALEIVDTVIAIGEAPEMTIHAYCQALGEQSPPLTPAKLEKGEALVWSRRDGGEPFWVRSAPPSGIRKRHQRKYVEGELAPDLSFYFRGPEGKLNLRAQNLIIFLQLAEGVDDETWAYHLRRGEYSNWFRDVIKDPVLAEEATRVEAKDDLSPAESRARIRAAIERRYTAPV